MSTAVSLKSIVDALQGVSDEYPSFLDLDSGEVITVSSEMLSAAEESEEGEEPDLLDWERDLYEAAKRVVHAERCLALPTQFDIHEWEIMADFVDSLEPGRIKQELADAIQGRGAFRHFKEALRRHNRQPAWYAFREEALREIAIEWCRDNEVAWS